MTPSNPTNGQPFIFRILDSLGIPHQVVPVDHTHRELVGDSISFIVGGTEIEIELSDVPNLLRAISDPDTVPTENSTKLVTSGGVYSALRGKMDKRNFDSYPIINSNNLITSGNICKAIAENGEITSLLVENISTQTLQNVVPWYQNKETEKHFLLKNISGQPRPVKSLWVSTGGPIYYADELGDVRQDRWCMVTIRRCIRNNDEFFTVTLDGTYTPTT